MTSVVERPDLVQWTFEPPEEIARELRTTRRGRAQARHRRDRREAAWIVWVASLVVLAGALTIRLVGISTANDVFIDELTYSTLSTMLAHGQQPALFGVPFFLHPPGAMLPDALAIRVLGLSGSPVDVAIGLRPVHAVLGAVTVLLAFHVVRAVTSTGIALGAATVLAFDPFALRIDTRVLLETSMALWLTAGMLALLVALTRPLGRSRTALELSAGLLLGCAVLCKDMAAIPIAVALVLAVVWRRTLPMVSALRVAGALPLPYLGYLLWVAGHGLLGSWAATKTVGLHRLVGAKQETGFNAVGAPSLVSRLLVQLGSFGTSYVLIGLCLAVGVAAAFSPYRGRCMVGMLAVGAGLLGGYAAAAGTLEEQFGYVVVVASVLASAVTVAEVVDRALFVRTVAVACVAFIGLTCTLGVRARTFDDDGLRQVRAWMQDELPPGTRVGLTGVTAEFGLLPHDGYGVWPSLESLAHNRAAYVMTQNVPLSQGYGYSAPALLAWLRGNATPVFTFHGPTNGDTVVWQLDQAKLDDAVAGGLLIPPVKGGYT